MKIKGLKSLLGLSALAASAIVVVQYQNCAPAGVGSAFVLSSTSGSSTPGAMTVDSITLASTALPAATTEAATAVIAYGGTTDTCNWTILNSASAVVSTSTTTSAAGVCSLEFTTPATVSTYALNLSVVSSSGETATSSVNFTIFSASLTPTPAVGIVGVTEFKFTASAVADTPQIFTVAIGTIANGVKTPLPGCTLTSTTAATTYSPSCTATFDTVGEVALYVEVTIGTESLVCDAVTTGCTGTYGVDVIHITTLGKRELPF